MKDEPVNSKSGPQPELQSETKWAGGMDAARLPAPWPELVANANAILAKARGTSREPPARKNDALDSK